MNVLIAGAGLGGLALALKLHRLGLRVTVIDAVKELRPLGVGINLLPHGAAVLYELGLGERLAETGIQTRAVEYRTQWGQLILRDPRGLHAGSPWPQYSIHRGELHKILLDAVLAELPAGSVATGHRVEGFDHTAKGGVDVRVRRADDSLVRLETDILIGADGIHSAVCRQLHPDQSSLAFSGTMMWRGAIERDPFLDGETMIIAGHHDSKVVIYPISTEARTARPLAGEPDGGDSYRQASVLSAGGLEPPGKGGRIHFGFPGLEIRLSRRSGNVPRYQGPVCVSDGRSRPVAILGQGRCHAAG